MIIDPRLFLVLGWGVVNASMALYATSLTGREMAAGASVSPITEVQGSIPAYIQIIPDLVLPKPDQKLTKTLERPLFVPTRRPAPPPPPPPPPPKPTMKKGQFQLMGVIAVGKGGYALLREVAGGKTRRLEVGDSVYGIRLSELAPNNVLLTQYEDTERLTLKVLPSGRVPTIGANVTVAVPGDDPAKRRQMASQRVPERPLDTAIGQETAHQPSTQPLAATAAASGGSAPPKTRFGP